MSDYLGAGANLLGGIGSIIMGKKNLEFQKEKLAYDKNLQQQIFGREDTSIQRRALDMEKAGLSRTLAAGGGASAGSVVGTSAPQFDDGGGIERIGKTPEVALSLKAQREGIAQTKANVDYTNSQTDKVKKETSILATDHEMKRVNLMFQEAFNDKNLEAMATKNRIAKLQERQTELNNKIKQQNITKNEIDIVIRQLDKNRVTQTLSIGEKELLARQLALDIGRHNLSMAIKFGLPTTASPTNIQKYSSQLDALRDRSGIDFGSMPPMQ